MGKAGTELVSTNAGSGDLWKRALMFTLWVTVILWDPWELDAVVLPTLGHSYFFCVCTSSKVNNYKRENKTMQNMRFQETVFLIHMHENLHEYSVMLILLFC